MINGVFFALQTTTDLPHHCYKNKNKRCLHAKKHPNVGVTLECPPPNINISGATKHVLRRGMCEKWTTNVLKETVRFSTIFSVK